MKFTSHKDAYTDYHGTEIKEWNTEFDCPFTPGTYNGKKCICWAMYQGVFGEWKIRESYVVAIKFTNCWLICLDNGWEFFEDRIGTEIFEYDDLDKVIRICEEKNRMRRVKVKRLRG